LAHGRRLARQVAFAQRRCVRGWPGIRISRLSFSCSLDFGWPKGAIDDRFPGHNGNPLASHPATILPSNRRNSGHTVSLAVLDTKNFAFRWMSLVGHEEQFSPPTLSARYVIRQKTFAGTHGNGRDAPIPAVRMAAG
jgi:hypothetical protein